MIQQMLEVIEPMLVEASATLGYQPMGPFVDRYGSWQLMFHRRSAGIDRFVDFSLTPSLPTPDQASGEFEVEAGIGAEQGKHQKSRSVSWSYSVDEEQFDGLDSDPI